MVRVELTIPGRTPTPTRTQWREWIRAVVSTNRRKNEAHHLQIGAAWRLVLADEAAEIERIEAEIGRTQAAVIHEMFCLLDSAEHIPAFTNRRGTLEAKKRFLRHIHGRLSTELSMCSPIECALSEDTFPVNLHQPLTPLERELLAILLCVGELLKPEAPGKAHAAAVRLIQKGLQLIEEKANHSRPLDSATRLYKRPTLVKPQLQPNKP